MFSYADDLDIPQPDSEDTEKNGVIEFSEMGINVGVQASNKISIFGFIVFFFAGSGNFTHPQSQTILFTNFEVRLK